MSTATDRYRAARDLLLEHRSDPGRAHAEFAWPDVGDTFSWAVDWFDAVARGNDQLALVIVEEDGTSTERTFDQMATASNQSTAQLNRSPTSGQENSACARSGSSRRSSSRSRAAR